VTAVELDPLLLSFQVATLATAIAAVIGISVAALLASFKFPGRDVVDILFTAPMVMPPTVLGYYLLYAVGRESVLGRAWHALTGDTIVFTKTGAVVAAVVGALPLVVKSVRAALEDTDPTLVLAARTLGASGLRAFFTIQLPLATRGISAALMLAFTRALGEFGITLMIAGDIPGVTRTASLAIYDDLQSRRDHEAAMLAVVLTVIALVVLYVTGKLTRRRIGP
jgi:molybdate transport system permease protein